MRTSRAAFVREATRFKAMHNLVDDPARDSQVIDGAVANATSLHLPGAIAKAVFTEIINASVAFELCVVCVLFASHVNDFYSLVVQLV